MLKLRLYTKQISSQFRKGGQSHKHAHPLACTERIEYGGHGAKRAFAHSTQPLRSGRPITFERRENRLSKRPHRNGAFDFYYSASLVVV